MNNLITDYFLVVTIFFTLAIGLFLVLRKIELI
nr:cytochrome b6-f complex subunit 6 [Meringosphaera mediterranea]WLD06317.1 cytochrome b6-f complex subunit 6 [Meringosphaera mediterranea]